jgi:hypothetical protein
LRTLSYRPGKTRLAGAAVLAVAITALLYGLFRLTDGAGAQPVRAGDPGAGDGADRRGAVAQIAVEVGRDYPVELHTHCGITVTEFGGRRWKADRPVATSGPGGARTDGAGTGGARTDGAGPGGTGTGGAGTGGDKAGRVGLGPVISGVMRLLDTDTLRFTAADTGLVVLFRPTRESPPACS